MDENELKMCKKHGARAIRSPAQVVITGASSGLGLAAAKSLAEQGWQVVMACRDFQKAEKAAKEAGMDPETYQARSNYSI